MEKDDNPQGFSDEQLAARKAMMEDAGPVVEDEPTPDPVEEAPAEKQEAPEQPEEREEKPEFKSSREQKEKPPEGYVPHQALHAEREARKALQKQMEELQAKFDAAQPKEQEPQWVDPLEDPAGHRKWTEYQSQTSSQKARDEAIAEFRKQHETEQRQAQRAMKAQEAEQAFLKDNPDYIEATQHLQQARISELRAQGYDDNQIRAQLSQDANALFDAAETVGMNVAQMVYLQAQQRGYQKKAAGDPEPEQKIKHLAEAEQKARGAGNAGGAPQKGELTIKQLAQTSLDEWGKLDPAAKRKAMGG